MKEVPQNIITRAAGGDEEAFEEIYRVFSDYVYTVASRITGNAEDAEEVTQDVFVSLYRNLWKFKFKSSLKTWVYRITVNMAINSRRKKVRRKEVNFDSRDIERMEDTSRTFGKPEYNLDRHNILTRLLGVLPAEQRACIALRGIRGMSYEEIAKIMRINKNTVRSRLKRAREKLMLLYKKEKRHEL